MAVINLRQVSAMAAALVERWLQLVSMHTPQTNRLSTMCMEAVRRQNRAHLDWLGQQLHDVCAAIRQAVEHCPLWCAMEDLFRSVLGIGRATACVLLAELPELGMLAALVGGLRIAPNRGRGAGDAQSGTVGPAWSIRRPHLQAFPTRAPCRCDRPLGHPL